MGVFTKNLNLVHIEFLPTASIFKAHVRFLSVHEHLCHIIKIDHKG